MSTRPTKESVKDALAALDTDFPGKQVPQNRPGGESPIDDTEDWRTMGQVHHIGGQTVELFPIRALSTAFGRSANTLRAWENSGRLPPTFLRTPAPQHALPGATARGRRLWSMAMIEGMLEIAADERCVINDGPPPTDGFVFRVKRLFADLRKQTK